MRRDERVTFQEKTVTYNDHNDAVESWADLTTNPTMWARVIPSTSGEDFNERQEQGFQRHRFRVLHRDDIDVENRLQWDGKNWDIRSVTPVKDQPRRWKLEIVAEWTENS